MENKEDLEAKASHRRSDDDDDEEEESRKKPKLQLLQHAADSDTVKVYDNARRFEKRAGDEWSCVELYWDNNYPSSEGPRILKKLSGGPIIPDVEETTRFDQHKEMMDAVEKQVRTLVKDEGYQEVENFVKLHKIHLPSFHWDVQDYEQSGAVVLQPTDSFVRGSPALLKGESWPKVGGTPGVFLFQINLSQVPSRMKHLVGKEGLLQLFWNAEEYSEGYGRVIPPKDFSKLELQSPSTEEEEEEEEEDPQGIPVRPGRIAGWNERPDYPPNFNCSFAELSDNGEETAETEALAKQSDSLHHQGTDGIKFGGYPFFCQDNGGLSLVERKPCSTCEQHNHLFCPETINIYMDWGGTAQVSYCPEQPDQISIQASCT